MFMKMCSYRSARFSVLYKQINNTGAQSEEDELVETPCPAYVCMYVCMYVCIYVCVRMRCRRCCSK